MKEKLLSIIIPVYNVEQYIHSCLNSILQQDIDEDNYEIIMIDDESPDRSMTVIEDLLNEHSNIIILRQKNQGPSAARNYGVSQAKGKYILYVDSDDLLVENSIKTLLDIAVREEADLVVGDYIVKNEDDQEPIGTKLPKSPEIIVKNGLRLFMEDLDPNECYIWKVMYSKEYLRKINLHFIEGISFEDIPYLQECYLRAGKCVRIHYPFYIYRKRHGTLSTVINEKIVYDLNMSLAQTWKLTLLDNITKQERDRLKDNLFATFSKDLWYISNHRELLKNRKKYVADLKAKIPELAFHNGMKQRMVSWFFNVMPCTYLKLRSWF